MVGHGHVFTPRHVGVVAPNGDTTPEGPDRDAPGDTRPVDTIADSSLYGHGLTSVDAGAVPPYGDGWSYVASEHSVYDGSSSRLGWVGEVSTTTTVV